MNSKFKQTAKRLISGFVAAATAITMFPAIPTMAEDLERYPYTLFAASSAEGSITTTSFNFSVNGNIATNGTISTVGNMNINGTKTENAGLDMIYIFDKLDSKYFSGENIEEHTEDYVLDELNIHVSKPTEVLGEAELTGNVNLNTALKAFKDVKLNGEVLNANDSVIYSKYGDIVIDSTNVNLNGLVYAPFGSVEVKAMNLNLNNVVIIADSIKFDCPNVNANYSTSVADFVGTVSEPLNIPKDEWQYMKDENENGFPDFFEDFENWSKLADSDGDGLPDIIEEYLGSDPNNIDTDGDGLNDYYEVFSTFTDPTKVDTDDNGVNDGDEDFDKDGLINLEEFDNKTNPYIADTDNDGLDDGYEVKTYGTNPLVADTDGDGLDDNDEIVLGTNPLVQDTDGNGVIDSKEKFQQTFTHKVKKEDCAVTEVVVDMECTGNINKTTTVESIMNVDILCTDVVGLVGEPFEIETDSGFDKATLTFKVDKNKLGNVEFENLLFLWYNEEENEFIELETTLDEENGTVSIETTHFSRYMVVDKKAWFDAWAIEFNYNPSSDSVSHGAPTIRYNTVLAIDCSGSMSWNDPYSQRADAAEKFIEYMHTNDKTAIVFFTSSAQLAASMSNDAAALKNTLNRIYSSGGTDFSAALNKALSAFDAKDINASYVNNRIILLSDGEDGGSTYALNNALESCLDKKIKVYTVGFGSASDSLMQRIADKTKGEYFKAFSADDLVDIFAEIGYSSDFDMTDTDHDGLPDAVESAGIRLQNGKVIYLDPTDDDYDDDGLLDGEEIDPKPYIHLFSIPDRDPSFVGPVISESPKWSYFFRMISDPTKKDSDGDGYDDKSELNKYDSDPLHCDVLKYSLSKSDTFVPVVDSNGSIRYGGNQSWIIPKDASDNEIETLSHEKILGKGGCAIAAACDLILYLKRTNKDFNCNVNFDELGITDFDNITKEQYVNLFNFVGSNYVEPISFLDAANSIRDSVKDLNLNNYFERLYLFALTTEFESLKLVTDSTFTWGVMPWNYTDDIEKLISSHSASRMDFTQLILLRMNPILYIGLSGNPSFDDTFAEMLRNGIIKSLENDVPITLAFGLGGGYCFYKDSNLTDIGSEREKTGGHYINVTELVIDNITNTEYVKIATWGYSYFLNLDEFMSNFGIGGSMFLYGEKS